MERTHLEAAMIAFLSLAIACPFANAASNPTIYRCVEDDVVAYSDRPCGSNASAHEATDARISILEVTPPSPTRPPRVKPKPALADTVSIAAAQRERAKDCAKLERSMRDIRSKMRAGYDAREGERLRDRQRKLTAQQRELRC